MHYYYSQFCNSELLLESEFSIRLPQYESGVTVARRLDRRYILYLEHNYSEVVKNFPKDQKKKASQIRENHGQPQTSVTA